LENPTFAELPLGPKLQAAIIASGYTTPTPIQAQAIPVAVTGRDILGIAQTGTGKTASFVLPMIERLETGRARARMPRSLILAPTRELAAQCAQSFDRYGVNHRLNTALLIGGVSMDDQVKKLDRGVDVLIATPGRLLDHLQRGRIMLMGVEILVIDEADRMLDMGFIPDIEKICKMLPPRRQTLFFSATMPSEIKRLVDTFLKDPVRIEVAKPATTAKTITQKFRFCENGEDWAKREVLRELIGSEQVRNAIIFCNRKRDVAILHKSLVKHGFNAGALHGDMDQTSRMATLDKFRAGDLMLLAASDVAARGLDIPDVSHVFNYDIPWAGDDYVHRIGRTGRAGKEGVSLSLVTSDDLKLIKDIEKVTGEQPVWIGDAPTDADFADAGKRKRRGRSAAGGSRGEDRKAGGGRGEGRGEGRSGARPEGRRRGGEGGPRRETPRRDAPRADRIDSELPIAAGASEGVALEGQVSDVRPERPERERRRDRPRREPRPVDAIPGMGDQPVVEAKREDPRREGRRSERAPRDADRPRAEGDRQPRQQSARSQTARPAPASPRQDSPRQETQRQERPQRQDRAERQERPAQPRERERDRSPREAGRRQPEASGSGFADNVPAFLRRPVRPAKAASGE
jgi:superfamily II DNA/RNA helicase